MSAVNRKLFEISSDDITIINDITKLFKGKENLMNLNVYKTKLDTYILLAEFSSPIRIKLDEDPFKNCEVEVVKSFDKRCETLAEENTEVSTFGERKPKAKKTVKTTSIEEKLDRIIELLEQMKK